MNLEPIKARLAAATEGPWFVEGMPETAECRVLAIDGEPEPDNNYWGCIPVTSGGSVPADADLIAHAPTDLARLVAEVERLRAVIKAVREALKFGSYGLVPAGDVLSDLEAALEARTGS